MNLRQLHWALRTVQVAADDIRITTHNARAAGFTPIAEVHVWSETEEEPRRVELRPTHDLTAMLGRQGLLALLTTFLQEDAETGVYVWDEDEHQFLELAGLRWNGAGCIWCVTKDTPSWNDKHYGAHFTELTVG